MRKITVAFPDRWVASPLHRPANKFSCDGGPVQGFPGTNGQVTAMSQGGPERTVGAWNATNDGFSNSEGKSQIVVCG